MLGIKKRKQLELKAKEYDKLAYELDHIVVHITLNGHTLYYSTLYQLILVKRYTHNIELVRIHGNARVEANVYGTMEKRQGTQSVHKETR